MKMHSGILGVAVFIGFYCVKELLDINTINITIYYVLVRVMEVSAKMREKKHVHFDTNEIGNK